MGHSFILYSFYRRAELSLTDFGRMGRTEKSFFRPIKVTKMFVLFDIFSKTLVGMNAVYQMHWPNLNMLRHAEQAGTSALLSVTIRKVQMRVK